MSRIRKGFKDKCITRCVRVVFFFLFFSEKIKLGISCVLSAKQTIHIKFQALFSLKKLESSMQHLKGRAHKLIHVVWKKGMQ